MGGLADTRIRELKVAIGADHRGFPLKEALRVRLQQAGAEVVDVGTYEPERSSDYPDFAQKVARAVASQRAHFGIMICHTGQGSCIAANKVPGVRAALVWDREIAYFARAHNDANVICFPGSFIPIETAWEALVVFLTTPFEGGRHTRRVQKIEAMERETLASPSREAVEG